MTPEPKRAGRWSEAWLDLVAFAAGLAVAWWQRWEAADLVWSLWLSSLLVGYALIVWNLSRTLREFGGNALRDNASGHARAKGATAALLAGGFFVGLAFFTVHFGGFHFVHSVFLKQFFTLSIPGGGPEILEGSALYFEVLRRYWVFVPMAFIAERAAFRSRPIQLVDTTVTPEAIARRKRNAINEPMLAPYKNVIRMHLLIFFFFGAHLLRIDHFAVYAVVYAVYFFPWRLVRREKAPVVE